MAIRIIILSLFMLFYSCAKDIVINSFGTSINIGTDSTLDIITWNIENFPKQDTVTIDYLSELIDSLDVDIIAMQEIWGNGASNSFQNLKNKLDGWDGYSNHQGLLIYIKLNWYLTAYLK